MWKILHFILFMAPLIQSISSGGPKLRRSSHNNDNTCEQGSCYPATGDLLVGRQSQLRATSTCGLHRPQRYCVVSHLEHGTKCFTCDSRLPWTVGLSERSHRIENVVSSFKGRTSRWWQSEPGQALVSIQLDLEAEFHLTHLIMTFKTFRPRAMLVERSSDFGRTWQVYRYFAQNCALSFPRVRQRLQLRLTDVICEERYSSETPSTMGEVIFKVLPPSLSLVDPYSQAVQNLLKVTNLRINFTELHTLGDTLLDNRPEVKEKYYYALYDLTVRGSCSCYGHASRCLPVTNYSKSEATDRNMVHGRCECAHNTTGRNCEMCADFHHDLPWRPARPNKPNVCKKCNCNEHSTKCHFDPARFRSTGGLSGGVCDHCLHNTRGVNCQECQPFFYQDPDRDIRDLEICQPCDCDTFGSQNNGECHQLTDAVSGTVAGRCVCKEFVTGHRCDRCMVNYWNLQKDNPQGCEPCRCHTAGTIPGTACDVTTGQCQCKRYVTGLKCATCHHGFHSLNNSSVHGCSPCNCDIGGATRASCDQTSGQCECRLHIGGKQCQQVDVGYFFAYLDHYTFEAEFGRGRDNARVHVLEPPASPAKRWTGPGYMKVMEGDSVEWTVSGLPFTTYYDLVVRYETKMPDVFKDIRITLVRPGPVDPEGACAGFDLRTDLKTVSLHPDFGHQIVPRPSCLEKGVTYTLRMDFVSYIAGKKHPQATLLIDSIVLLPSTDYIPLYLGPGLPEYLKYEFESNKCQVVQYAASRPNLTDVCMRHTFSISAVLHNGAIACNCDNIGSLSLECQPSGGQCPCRPNVVGRTCDQCAPGTYGFGREGCLPCNCHEFGARDNFCHEDSGQCTCNHNLAGRACDQCPPGSWGFPQCRPCQCHGNALTCDPLTGACVGCGNFTTGDHCERCQHGYFTYQTEGLQRVCQPCLCPGGPGSLVQHADSCSGNISLGQVTCNCHHGYTGLACDKCMDNFYGSPFQPGGQCQPCLCHGNIDLNEPGSCEGSTGECLKCLFNTEGFACEHCRVGYWGDALKQSCVRCVCHQLGTDVNGGHCDRVHGQCPCHPNVVGQRCDSCAMGHWNISSLQGCVPCNCDPAGSVTAECNQLTGQCVCLPGRGGPTCSNCENLFYGDPNSQCFSCNCNPEGSKSLQCNRLTGQCPCVDGVTGQKCDHCARGTVGELPNCVPCGECFDNWEKIIFDLKEEMNEAINKVGHLPSPPQCSTYEEEFELLKRNIDEVARTLATVQDAYNNITDFEIHLETIKNNLMEHSKALNETNGGLWFITDQVKTERLKLQHILKRMEILKASAKTLKENITTIKIQEFRGAYDDLSPAENKSKQAQKKVEKALLTLSESERFRSEASRLFDARNENFELQHQDKYQHFENLKLEINSLQANLSLINDMMCGDSGSPCSALCGGGGCGRCGGDSCSGAVTTSQTAVGLVAKAGLLVSAKTQDATEGIISQILEVKQDTESAKLSADSAYQAALLSKNKTEATKCEIDELNTTIRHFLNDENMKNHELVKQIAMEVLAMNLSVHPNQVKSQMDGINEVVSYLTRIDDLLNETADSRELASGLQEQAIEVLNNSKILEQTTTKVKDNHTETIRLQALTSLIIQQVQGQMHDSDMDLEQVIEDVGQVEITLAKSSSILDTVSPRLNQLNKRRLSLEMDTLERTERAAGEAQKLASQVQETVNTLRTTIDETSEVLNTRYSEAKMTQDLSEKLKARADKLLQMAQARLMELKGIHDNIGRNEERLSRGQAEVHRLNIIMDSHLADIRAQEINYETC